MFFHCVEEGDRPVAPTNPRKAGSPPLKRGLRPASGGTSASLRLRYDRGAYGPAEAGECVRGELVRRTLRWGQVRLVGKYNAGDFVG